VNQFQSLFDTHKAYFNTNVTKSYQWRIEQLDRLAHLLTENQQGLRTAICEDFKTASEESLFEVTAPLGVIAAAKEPKPLSAFMFSRDQAAIDRFVNELSFGGGAVNRTNIHLFVGTMPFGGVGSSGIGHYYNKYGFDALTHAKSILISPPDVAIEHLFPPYTPAASNWPTKRKVPWAFSP